jgi:hypothetical protein
MVERHCEEIETSLPAVSLSWEWQIAQLPEPSKSAVEKVTKSVG